MPKWNKQTKTKYLFLILVCRCHSYHDIEFLQYCKKLKVVMIYVSSNSENSISIAIILQSRGIKYGNLEIIILISFEKRSQLQV